MGIEEADLAARLDAEIGTFIPGPLPLDAVIRRGRAAVIRRRLGAAAATLALIVVAALAPVLLHALHRAAPVAPRYHVTVSPPGPGADSRLVARGTINRTRWSFTAWFDRRPGNVCWHYPGGGGCVGGPRPRGTRGAPASFDANPMARGPGEQYMRPQIVEGFVRRDVTRLRVLFGNGQALTLRPVPVLGRQYASWVAVAVPFADALREVIAYSAHGEIGYTVPFTGRHSIEFSGRWLLPGQPALPAAAHRLIGRGSSDGVRWSVRAYTGPWGLCLRGYFPGLDFCLPAIAHVAPGKLVTQLTSSHSGNQSLVTLQAAPDVRRLAVRGAARGTLNLTPVRLGAWGYAVVPVQDPGNVYRWTAYDAAGKQLGAGSVRQF